jgi:hypothetical protein
MQPEIAMFSAGVATDVLGIDLCDLSIAEINQVAADHPCTDRAQAAVSARLLECPARLVLVDGTPRQTCGYFTVIRGGSALPKSWA